MGLGQVHHLPLTETQNLQTIQKFVLRIESGAGVTIGAIAPARANSDKSPISYAYVTSQLPRARAVAAMGGHT